MKKLFILIGILVFIVINIIIYDVIRVKEYESNIFYFDTYINIKVYSNDSKKAHKILKEIEKIYKDYHQLTDKYNKYDNLNNLYIINNSLSKDKYIEIDKRLVNILKYGIEMYKKSNGKINISMGNVIDIWNGYRSSGLGIPTVDELKYVNYNTIDEIDIKNNTIRTNNINIDLGCIAKGYATNEVKKYLNKIKMENYIVNAGGNVIVGKKYPNGLYTVALEDPNNSSSIYKTIKVENKSIVTSGGYNRFYTYDGKTYTHIIDPDTLFPVEYMKSVTVIADDSAYADFLSTYLFLMPVDEGIEYVNKLDNVEAIWYLNDDTIKSSKGFNKYE